MLHKLLLSWYCCTYKLCTAIRLISKVVCSKIAYRSTGCNIQVQKVKLCAGGRSPESLRDVRGFSVKFFTEEGNWDFVGNDIPVRPLQGHSQSFISSTVLWVSPIWTRLT